MSGCRVVALPCRVLEMTVFDLSWGHLIVVAVVALIVIGPKELPGVLRTIGQWTTRIRRMAAEFQGQFQEALREAEMADLRKEIDTIHDSARGLTSSLTDAVNIDDATRWRPESGTPKPEVLSAESLTAAGAPAADERIDTSGAVETTGAEAAAAEPSSALEPSASETTSSETTSAPVVAAVAAADGPHPAGSGEEVHRP